LPYWRKALGTRLENELANLLWSLGYAVVRGPSSGAGVRHRYQPDLVAVKQRVVLVIEVKKGRVGVTLYIPRHQVDGITEFARRAGGHAYIAVRLPRAGWRMHPVEDLEETRGGNMKIERPETGVRPEALDEIFFPKHRRLDEYMGEG